MSQRTRSRVRLAVAAFAALAVLGAGTAQAAPTPSQLYHALLKKPRAGSLPSALSGAKAHSAKLSPGSRSHHAVGAVEIGNTAALVGYLLFPSHALALADLKAFPPNRGPNKIVTTHPAGLPRPAFILSARGNGYEAAYAVFVLDNVVVDAWAYGTKGTSKKLRTIVEADARWAKSHALQAKAAAG